MGTILKTQKKSTMTQGRFVIISSGGSDAISMQDYLAEIECMQDRNLESFWIMKSDFFLKFETKLEKIKRFNPKFVLFTEKVFMDKAIKITADIREALGGQNPCKFVAVGVYGNGRTAPQTREYFKRHDIHYVEKTSDLKIFIENENLVTS